MSRFLKGVALLLGALVLQILVSHRVPWIQRAVDLVLLVVVYYGTAGARTGAMMAGAFGGLLEDAWFGDLIGLRGFTKTLIAYVLGGIGSRFDLTGLPARLLSVLLATLLEMGAEPAVRLGIGLPAGAPDPIELAWRAAGNLLVAALFFPLVGHRRAVPA